ncbi:MAG: GAF domain-containing protein, partial [Planctomycetes bacterium]|nr:GAF domain-containing protein [Planctomycetota bacterium]
MDTLAALQDRFARFAEIGIRLSTEHDLDRLLALILSEARGFTTADAGSLYVVDHGELVFRVSQNNTLDRGHDADRTRKFQSFRFPVSTSSLAGTVALRGTVLNIPDVQAHPLHNKEVDRRLGYTTRTMLVVPMTNRAEKIVGVLQLINALDGRGEPAPFDPSMHQMVLSLASQAAVCVENTQLYHDIRALFDALVRYSAKAIDARDPATAGHSSRVSALAVRVARAMNRFTDAQLRELRYAGFFHDIGKIGVREKVLTKQNRLYPEDLEVMRTRFAAWALAGERELYELLI